MKLPVAEVEIPFPIKGDSRRRADSRRSGGSAITAVSRQADTGDGGDDAAHSVNSADAADVVGHIDVVVRSVGEAADFDETGTDRRPSISFVPGLPGADYGANDAVFVDPTHPRHATMTDDDPTPRVD